jgi:high-affinity nickel permease
MVGAYTLLIAANALAWTWAVAEFASRPALLGTAFLAYFRVALRGRCGADGADALPMTQGLDEYSDIDALDLCQEL